MGDFFKGKGKGATVDIVALLDSEAGRLLHAVAGLGALVAITPTRDHGALSVGVTVDGDTVREYFRDSEELELWLKDGFEDIRDAVGAANAARDAAPPRKRLKGF